MQSLHQVDLIPSLARGPAAWRGRWRRGFPESHPGVRGGAGPIEKVSHHGYVAPRRAGGASGQFFQFFHAVVAPGRAGGSSLNCGRGSAVESDPSEVENSCIGRCRGRQGPPHSVKKRPAILIGRGTIIIDSLRMVTGRTGTVGNHSTLSALPRLSRCSPADTPDSNRVGRWDHRSSPRPWQPARQASLL